MTAEDGETSKTYTLTVKNAETPNTDFSDMEGQTEEAMKAIEKVAAAGLMKGDPAGEDGTVAFRPNADINRADFAIIMCRLNGFDEKTDLADYESENGNPFIDLSANHYAYHAIMKAYDEGWINGKGNKYDPQGQLTREEAATIINRSQKYTGTSDVTFSDDADIHDWAKDHVYACAANGVIQGRTDGTFDPTANIKRSEIAIILSRVLDIMDTPDDTNPDDTNPDDTNPDDTNPDDTNPDDATDGEDTAE